VIAKPDLTVRPLGFRAAAEFWAAAADPELAFRLHALIGGTPAYKDMCGGSGPPSLAEFDPWVQRWLLDPAGAMFREGGLLLRDEPSISDQAAYASALGAISAGSAQRSAIAAALGWPPGAIDSVLTRLADLGLIERLTDPLRGDHSAFVIIAPIVRLHQLIIAPCEPELAAGRAEQVWARSSATVAGKIYAPHFKSVARQWCLRHADEGTLGGAARAARPTEIPCREHRQAHELDIVVFEDPAPAGRITAIGAARQTTAPVNAQQLTELEHLRALLPADRVAQPPKLLLFSRTGFTPELTEQTAARPDAELISLAHIYHGT
jgi:hypothetical protein